MHRLDTCSASWISRMDPINCHSLHLPVSVSQVCTLFVLFQIREIAGKSSFISSYAALRAPKYIVLASTKHSGASFPSLPWQEEPRSEKMSSANQEVWKMEWEKLKREWNRKNKGCRKRERGGGGEKGRRQEVAFKLTVVKFVVWEKRSGLRTDTCWGTKMKKFI